ncbi:type II toxin-antitoxin system Phd/YefM family antitoxin [Gordonia sp. OPL2]|uniref:type II toxin-antitoxin system Phd/YefM family antitoxin n=1 Tax=Gordonia sp. OPL2 TaxID=2486274 RepID=UPI0021CD15A3|nr:type II toxin-antitoxin system prevent-host-death family antitoxin [Gordonia sp. OPL2]
MTTIGVRELCRHASRYLAQVEAGDEISITNRGKTVARLVPVSPETSGPEALIRTGVLTPTRSPGYPHDRGRGPARRRPDVGARPRAR